MKHYSTEEIIEIKRLFETNAKEHNVAIVLGTVETQGERQLNTFIKIEADENYDWSDLLKKVGQSVSPVLVLEVVGFEEEDFDCLPDNEDMDKELFGDNYNDAKKKVKEMQAILKGAKVNDIVSITATAYLGNFLIEATYFSVLSEVKYFEISDYYDDEEEEEEEDDFTPPTKSEIKKFQEKLKQILMDDPMFLTCTNKSLRQAFMKSKVDEMDLNERSSYYYMRESQHIVELAFAEAKNKK